MWRIPSIFKQAGVGDVGALRDVAAFHPWTGLGPFASESGRASSIDDLGLPAFQILEDILLVSYQ